MRLIRDARDGTPEEGRLAAGGVDATMGWRGLRECQRGGEGSPGFRQRLGRVLSQTGEGIRLP